MLGTGIDAGTTLDAFCAGTASLFGHVLYIQAHWASLIASLTGDAVFFLCRDLQSGQMQKPTEFGTQRHERSNPAKIMTENPFAK